MSLRSIELQFVLQKNDEAGVKQHQMMHKPVEDQTSLSEAAEKNIVNERHVTAKLDEIHQASVNDHAPKKQHGRTGKRGSQNRQDQSQGEAGHNDHPFKGRNIDLSL
ncbi:hypothetical protein [Paenibacillus cremeus]|uniref:Uncharacterized protein n=1 Tax=Paenibacillus cremeus TaxID=2163881 RepID=A0A559KES5_9BACL|nr:hypothetical protein [Paenibacillus cremeus]TVY10631.1 hypothetical protein FPZ49_07810 [Paenibacillus cremeus]